MSEEFSIIDDHGPVPSLFWADLNKDLDDPENRQIYDQIVGESFDEYLAEIAPKMGLSLSALRNVMIDFTAKVHLTKRQFRKMAKLMEQTPPRLKPRKQTHWRRRRG